MSARLLTVLAALLVLAVLAVRPWTRADRATPLTAAPPAGASPVEPPAGEAARLERPADGPADGARTAAPEESVAAPEPATDASFACTFAGRFVDVQGRPLARVDVRAELVPGLARSAADGTFALELELPALLRGRALELAASHPGYATRRMEGVASAGRVELGEVVLTPGGRIAGRVVDEHGAGFPGALVAVTDVAALVFGLYDTGPTDMLVETQSGPAGAFLLEGVPVGDARVWAGAEGRLWAYSDGLLVRPGEELTGVELRLEPVPSEDVITLVVVDPEGQPVPRARVRYRYQAEGLSGAGNAVTDGGGRLRFVLPVRTPHDFTARDAEERYRPAVALAVPPGTVDHVLRLGEPRSMTLEVSGPEGPVEAFTARLEAVLRERSLSLGSVSASEEAGAAPGTAVFQLPIDPFRLTVEAEGFERETLGPLDPVRQGATLAVSLRPLPGVSGRVVDRGGQPVAGAQVGLYEAVAEGRRLEVNGFPARSERHAEARATSDEEGRFRLTLRAAGRYYLRAEAPGLAPGEEGPLDLAPERGVSGLAVALGPGGAIEGRVLVPAGESAAGRIVGTSRGDGHGVTARADAAGVFRFEHLTPGDWLVVERREEVRPGTTSSSSGSADEPVELPWSCTVVEGATTRFDLDLTRASRAVLAGRLRFDGAPATGWEATLLRLPAGGEEAGDRVDSQGRFRLAAADPGTYQVRVVGQLDGSPLWFLSQELELAVGERVWDVDLALGRLEGTAPLGDGARLSYSWSRDDGLQLGCGFTPDQGTFGLPVPAGAGRLQRQGDGEPEPARELDVAAGATVRVDLP